jgi:hypothetical protein
MTDAGSGSWVAALNLLGLCGNPPLARDSGTWPQFKVIAYVESIGAKRILLPPRPNTKLEDWSPETPIHTATDGTRT